MGGMERRIQRLPSDALAVPIVPPLWHFATDYFLPCLTLFRGECRMVFDKSLRREFRKVRDLGLILLPQKRRKLVAAL